jgi:tetratricopeptide (TPR) repeat protein
MKKFILNSTEGGAKIKGTIPIPLCDFINKYCQKSIDKSKLTPFLKLADDGDDLIKKVIPLLQEDINNLNTIIKSSRIGIASSHGMKTLMNRRTYENLMKKKTEKIFENCLTEARQECANNPLEINYKFYEKILKNNTNERLKHIIKLSQCNYKHSEQAHHASIKNPLVNVAIYGASRAIQGRALKVDETLVNFLKDKKITFTRLERNTLILSTAKKASESLKKSYTDTLNLLKKYNKTKNDKLLRPVKPEKINLKDVEKYFTANNWAHPLIDAKKIINQYKHNPKISKTRYQQALKIYNKAVTMRNNAIKIAIQNETQNLDYERKLLKYNALLEQSKEAGDAGKKEKDFDKAVELLQKAVELLPDEIEGRWGLATAIHHSGDIKKAITEYKKLVEDFPDKVRFNFEYGQVLLLDNQIQEGLQEIGKAMEKTDEFDSFLIRIGEIYQHTELYNEAIIAYENYLNKFPYDTIAISKKAECHMEINETEMAEQLIAKAKKLKG